MHGENVHLALPWPDDVATTLVWHICSQLSPTAPKLLGELPFCCVAMRYAWSSYKMLAGWYTPPPKSAGSLMHCVFSGKA